MSLAQVGPVDSRREGAGRAVRSTDARRPKIAETTIELDHVPRRLRREGRRSGRKFEFYQENWSRISWDSAYDGGVGVTVAQ